MQCKHRREKEEKDPINMFYMFKKIYPICFRSNKSYYLFRKFMGICFGVSFGLNVLVTQFFLDTVYQAAMFADGSALRHVMITLILFLAVKVANNILVAVVNHMGNVERSRIIGYMQREINKKSAVIDPIEYEDPKRLDDITKARNGLEAAISFHDTTTSIFTFYLPYFIFMGFYLFALQPMLLLSLMFVFVPVVISQILRSTLFAQLEDQSVPIRREFDAFSEAASGKSFFKETRLLGSFKYFKNLLMQSMNSLNKVIWQAQKKSALVDLGFNILSLLGYGGILFLLVRYLLNGDISVGAFAAVFSGIRMMFAMMEEIITWHIGDIAKNFGQIRNFLRFIAISSDNRPDVEISKNGVISLQNVSFRYPNAAEDSLKNINLTINPGETIAIVGENGSGKTTLVKLLTGLYKPTAGIVKIDGYDTNDASYSSLFKNVSGVFQKYQHYALNLRENVAIANFDGESDQVKIERMLDENNVDWDNKDVFPKGLDTMLSRDFDGVELSGGQWQRVAIARGFYRNSHTIVLDEPTAAIDPLEESAIYNKFVEIARDKTAIVITHRLGSAKIAERIIVMHEGEIVEIGDHDELVEYGGEYAQMYRVQSEWYN